MLSIYPACFFKEENGYSVVFPDLDFLSTCGETLEEAMSMAIDSLAGYLKWLIDDEENVPIASPLNSVSPQSVAEEINIECNEAFTSMVSVDVDSYAKEHFNKSVKKTLSIPSWLNKAAMEKGINFSRTLQDALIAKLHKA